MKTQLVLVALMSLLSLTPSATAQNKKNNGNHSGRSSRNDKHSQRYGGQGARYGGRRLERGNFREHFGEGHRFVGEFRVGFTAGFFVGDYEWDFVDPWPAAWGYTDEIYIEDINGGYFVYNPLYPDMRIAVVLR